MSESISEGMTVDQTLQESCKDALRHMSVEVTALINKTNNLESENNHLREAAEEFRQDNEHLYVKLKQYKQLIQAQNPHEYVEFFENYIKRGELIRDMMKFFEDDDTCEHCGHDVECWKQNGLTVAYSEDCLMRDVFKKRMHELGIEVADE